MRMEICHFAEYEHFYIQRPPGGIPPAGRSNGGRISYNGSPPIAPGLINAIRMCV